MSSISDFIGALVKSPFICLGWIIIGALAGAIAHNVMKSRGSLVGDVVLGLIGALVGGFLLGLFGVGKPDGGLVLVIVNLVIATVGAIILIAVGRMIRGQRVA